MITKALVLSHYNLYLEIILKTDAFDYVNNRVLSQLQEDGLVYQVVFFLKNVNFIKYNYEIYHIKLLAIIQCFE